MKKFLPLLLLVAVASGILIYAQTRPESVANTNTTAPITVQVVIDTGDGQPTNTYTVANPNPATVFAATQVAAQGSGTSLTYDPPGEYGIFVREIAGKDTTDTHFWNYKLNGEEGTVGADSQSVKDGDVISWTYTKIIPQ